MPLFKQLLHNKKAVLGLAILFVVILVAIFAPVLTEYSPTQRVGRPHQAPSAEHWLGTTRLGQFKRMGAAKGPQAPVLGHRRWLARRAGRA